MKFINQKKTNRIVSYSEELICLLLFSIVLLLFVGCSSQDKNMERILTEILIEFKNSNKEFLDLRTVFVDKWEEVCIRGPYELTEHFEKKIGRKIPMNDSPQDDGIIVFWVFDRDGKGRWAQVSRVNVMDTYFSKGTSCTTINNPYIYAAYDRGERKYYFLGQGK